ncbi:MAG: TauD/TfdA family dioxygenase [Leptolyngbyaceae cyanobacterium SU_3_3]|nr:TauD/TfdA family dioxygenase [Leptolyngbyaceae cyanobacterium SU_3_3]NJR41048.1 TauD/TfdA family dioxygenase [Leptolyngbyaceae cyanobacterium CSU_1_4]
MQTHTEIAVRPLTSFLGAEIEGVDAARAISTDMLTQLNEALIESQLLVLRNQTITVEQQIAFSRNFGELEQFSPHPHYQKHPEIFPVSNRQEDGYLNVGHYWHHDGSFLETPTRLSLFYFLKAPLKGGDFLFTNMYLAHETLPETLKQQVEPLETLHNNGVVHSLVRSHPITGRKALYINMGLTVGIVGLSHEESVWLIRDLNRHLNRPEFVYRHKLQVGDLIICDNASVAHFANYADPQYPQLQRRTTVCGTVRF